MYIFVGSIWDVQSTMYFFVGSIWDVRRTLHFSAVLARGARLLQGDPKFGQGVGYQGSELYVEQMQGVFPVLHGAACWGTGDGRSGLAVCPNSETLSHEHVLKMRGVWSVPWDPRHNFLGILFQN